MKIKLQKAENRLWNLSTLKNRLYGIQFTAQAEH